MKGFYNYVLCVLRFQMPIEVQKIRIPDSAFRIPHSSILDPRSSILEPV